MKKLLDFAGKLIKWLIITAIIMVVAAFVFAYIYEDEVKQSIVKQLNKNLEAEIMVEDISLSLIKRFPFASLTFKNTMAYDATGNKDTLLAAEKVFLQFNILDIIKKKYQIKRIEINHALVKIKIFKDGTNNFEIWKPKGDTLKKFSFQLNRVIFNEVKVHYINNYSNEEYVFFTPNAQAKGNFTKDLFQMDMDGVFDVKKLVSGNITYLSNDNLDLDIGLQVNAQKKEYKIHRGKATLNGLSFDVTGMIKQSQNKKFVDLQVIAHQMKLESLLAELPLKWVKNVKDKYHSQGSIIFNTKIKGFLGAGLIPSINADFSMKDGSIEPKNGNISLKKVNFKGKYSNGNNNNAQESYVHLSTFSFLIGSGEAKGQFKVRNFIHPHISLELTANSDLSDIKRFFVLDTLEHLKGNIKMNLEFNGSMSKPWTFTANDFMKSKSKGDVKIQNVDFAFKKAKKNYTGINGDFRFNNNDLIVNQLSGNIGSNDFHIQGYARNLVTYLMLPKQKLWVEAKFHSDDFNLNEFLKNKTLQNNSSNYLTFPHYWGFDLEISLDKFTYGEFTANNLGGNVLLRNQKFIANYLEMDAMHGSISLNGKSDATKKPFFVSCNALLQDVNIKDMFLKTRNFGQKSLQHHNLEGLLTTNLHFEANISPYVEIKPSSVYAKAGITIENGQLIDYTPLKKLSDFLKIDDLKQVKFNTLRNQIEIKDKMVYIPQMEVNSNLMNLEASGTHSFDNKIDYHIKILMSELLALKAKKAKRENNEFGYIEDDGIKTSLFIHVKGTAENPEFKYDRKKVKEKIIQDIKTERENLKQVIKEEFHWFVKDSIKKAKKEKEKERLKKQEEGKFIIEWEENQDTL